MQPTVPVMFFTSESATPLYTHPRERKRTVRAAISPLEKFRNEGCSPLDPASLVQAHVPCCAEPVNVFEAWFNLVNPFAWHDAFMVPLNRIFEIQGAQRKLSPRGARACRLA